MPWRCLKTTDPHRKSSRELDKRIGLWMKNYRKSIKLLLLGAAESGKTTIIKQMKILHVQGFTESERMEKAKEVRRNLLQAIKELTGSMAYIKPPVVLADLDNLPCLEYINGMDVDGFDYEYPEIFYDYTKRLWLDAGVQECFRRSNEFLLLDSAKYFLNRVDIIRREDYVPSDSDILRCRKRTSDIQRIEFEVKVASKYGGGTQSFWMFDVGGQRGERRKWIQVFDGITAVLFLVACSGYDTKIREDRETNRLQEDLALFEEVWCSRFLQDSGFILFLNKQDILREKIEAGSTIEKYFPEYVTYQFAGEKTGEYSEYLKARSFIKDKFMAITKKTPDHRKYSTDHYVYYENFEAPKQRECFWHYTTATDTDNIKRVFQDIHTMILLWNLKKITPT